MSHKHHHHHPEVNESTIFRLWVSIILNLIITIAEIIGGLLSNSLALLSDAVHNLSDTASLGITLVAKKIAKRGSNTEKTFGYKRAEIIGAFINLITLVLIALFLIKEGFERFLNPQEIDGFMMLWVSVVGLLGNVITAVLLYRDSKSSLNMRSAFIHILSDGLSSVAVIIGGWLVYKYQWYIIDPILTLLIGAYILWHSYHMLRETINILMEAKPEDIDSKELVTAMKAVPNVCDVHHLHVWQLDEHNILLESHVVIEEQDLRKMEEIKSALKEMLFHDFGIQHSTLEFEFELCDSQKHANEPHHHHHHGHDH